MKIKIDGNEMKLILIMLVSLMAHAGNNYIVFDGVIKTSETSNGIQHTIQCSIYSESEFIETVNIMAFRSFNAVQLNSFQSYCEEFLEVEYEQ